MVLRYIMYFPFCESSDIFRLETRQCYILKFARWWYQLDIRQLVWSSSSEYDTRGKVCYL